MRNAAREIRGANWLGLDGEALHVSLEGIAERGTGPGGRHATRAAWTEWSGTADSHVTKLEACQADVAVLRAERADAGLSRYPRTSCRPLAPVDPRRFQGRHMRSAIS
jgi:hypothetical protein